MFNAAGPWRIAVTGSAGVGKTSLVEKLAPALGVPTIEEEMRAWLRQGHARLSELPRSEAAALLLKLWQERAQRERTDAAFVADNCSLDFIAYALHYGCLTEELAAFLLPEAQAFASRYDAVFVLPWGILPYVDDGIRTPSHHAQLGYQLIIEGLCRRYMDPSRLHYLPDGLTDIDSRCQWACSILDHKRSINQTRNDQGIVYLVGAGPGDPRLLTLRAYELLQKADVVAHDLLVSQALLSLIPAGKELLPVGRRYGAEKTSYRLHPDVLDRARQGKTVVRLKCGDPLIFGRGGEEAEELSEAGIPFEIVPGISAALGAAAYSGIPLTHRLYSSQLVLSTGHDSAERTRTSDTPDCKDQGTTVLYMAARRMRANLENLIKAGYSPGTPAAYVAGATTPNQRVITGTLANLAEKASAIHCAMPGLVITGPVVELRDKIAWFEKQQLQGYRILLARARPGPSIIAKHLRDLGAEVIEAPEISLAPLPTISDAIKRLDYDALVFGCAAGVEYTWPEIVAREFRRPVQLVAIGEQAGNALLRMGTQDFVSCHGSCEDALQSVAESLRGKRLLLITSNEGRPALVKQLSTIAMSVAVLNTYQVTHDFSALETEQEFDLVIAPGSSAARLVLTNSRITLKDIPFVTMGPLSAEAARREGAHTIIQSPEDSIESLIECVITQLTDKQRAITAALAGDGFMHTRAGA
ncbi:MAG TPA: uroporphyrinogen-III C-methyltransferase [Candidatus Angelobacter sp.]|nr:uroporphyrinogen-III C-methyltransferase [Candidatus Angelobacter sp.]